MLLNTKAENWTEDTDDTETSEANQAKHETIGAFFNFNKINVTFNIILKKRMYSNSSIEFFHIT